VAWGTVPEGAIVVAPDARADTTPPCSPACCAPDDRTPDPTGAVECCFCEE
jgi:hypothetical protein